MSIRMRLIWADLASAGDLVASPWGLRPWRKIRLEIVERTLEWFNLCRRLGDE